jgi:hypothetical protein
MLDNEVTIAAIKETAKEIALLLGGVNVILVALITWLGKRWMDKTLESERRRTQVLVEQVKSALTQEREQANQVLKTQLDQSRFFFEKTISFFSENQKAAGEKRLLAFEKLWKTIYELRKLAPFYLDIILASGYDLVKTNPYFKSTIESIQEQELLDKYQSVSSEFELLRIYIPTLIWQLYDSYKLIVLRPQLLLKMSLTYKSNTSTIPWYQDETLHNIIVSLLKEEEAEEFDTLKLGQLTWILNRVETKILDLLQRYIAGEIALKEMSEQAALLDKANRQAQEKLYESERELKAKNIE